jgi:hypothetical protein
MFMSVGLILVWFINFAMIRRIESTSTGGHVIPRKIVKNE